MVQAQFEDFVHFENGRYVVSLPWKESAIMLNDNYNLCFKRLNSLFRRLKSNPDLLK